jgi:hypothetical protein
MSNETNFRRAEMNINLGLTKDYENDSLAGADKTKPILPSCARSFFLFTLNFLIPSPLRALWKKKLCA